MIFAIVLLTPDDVGRAKSAPVDEINDRARQNVILELGYFFGRLNRANVRCLYAEGIELPSDLLGILYIKLDQADAWKHKLAKEMQAAGLDVSLDKVV